MKLVCARSEAASGAEKAFIAADLTVPHKGRMNEKAVPGWNGLTWMLFSDGRVCQWSCVGRTCFSRGVNQISNCSTSASSIWYGSLS